MKITVKRVPNYKSRSDVLEHANNKRYGGTLEYTLDVLTDRPGLTVYVAYVTNGVMGKPRFARIDRFHDKDRKVTTITYNDLTVEAKRRWVELCNMKSNDATYKAQKR